MKILIILKPWLESITSVKRGQVVDVKNNIKLEFDESPVDKKWLGCHIEVPGYQLDDYHIATKLTDRDGVVSWGLFTFPNPIKNGIIEYSQNLKNTEIWHMDEIDPNDFEWNGRKFMLNETCLL